MMKTPRVGFLRGSLRVKWVRHDADHSPPLMQKSKMHAALPHNPCMPSQHDASKKGNCYFSKPTYILLTEQPSNCHISNWEATTA
jgi:hypothetical protein